MFLQSRVSQAYSVDIHPAARLGYGIMLDHAHGITIGGTAIVGNNCYILHGVTLGASGRPVAKNQRRHPSVGEYVLNSDFVLVV